MVISSVISYSNTEMKDPVSKDSVFTDEVLAIIGIIIFFLVLLYTTKKTNVLSQIKRDLHDPVFWGMLIITLIITIWGLRQDDPIRRSSIHSAVVALIASYFSHLSLIYPAFYIVLVVDYFSKKYVG